MRGDGPQFAGRNFDGQIHLALVTDLHDGGVRPAVSREEARDQLNRLLRCRKADAQRRPEREGFQTLEGNG